MNTTKVASLIRHLLTFGGGAAVTTGIVSPEDAQNGLEAGNAAIDTVLTAIGAIGTFTGIIWGWKEKNGRR